jgi:hypothetical protein
MSTSTSWINAVDKNWVLQRVTPRMPKSMWCQINRLHVDQLVAARRMTENGQRHIDAAKIGIIACSKDRTLCSYAGARGRFICKNERAQPPQAMHAL